MADVEADAGGAGRAVEAGGAGKLRRTRCHQQVVGVGEVLLVFRLRRRAGEMRMAADFFLGEVGAVTFQGLTPRLPADRYVITVKLEHPGRKDFEPFAVTPASKPVLVATLKTRRGIVAPLEVEFTGAGTSSSVHYFFPRTLDGAPLLGPGGDWAEFTLVGAGFAVHSKFKLDPEFLC